MYFGKGHLGRAVEGPEKHKDIGFTLGDVWHLDSFTAMSCAGLDRIGLRWPGWSASNQALEIILCQFISGLANSGKSYNTDLYHQDQEQRGIYYAPLAFGRKQSSGLAFQTETCKVSLYVTFLPTQTSKYNEHRRCQF